MLWLTLIWIYFNFLGSSKAQECDSVLTESGIIKSDGHPGGYPNNYDCIWIIEANDYDTVNIRFIDFEIEPGEGCEFDSLTIKAKDYEDKFCGTNRRKVGSNGRFSLKGRVTLHMVSDGSVNLRGISLQFQVTPGKPPPTTPPPTTVPTTTPSLGTTCDDEPCQNNADCTMLSPTEFYCFCKEGFEGDLCEINIDDCASSPCENGATCFDGIQSWTCECVPGYVGQTCGIDYDECRSDPCENGAPCEDRLNSFYCLCTKGWTGVYCSEDIDDCTPNPCQNYGVCEDHLGYHTCICHPLYTGENCTIPLEPPTTQAPQTATTPKTTTPPSPPTTTTAATVTPQPTTTSPTTTAATTTTILQPTIIVTTISQLTTTANQSIRNVPFSFQIEPDLALSADDNFNDTTIRTATTLSPLLQTTSKNEARATTQSPAIYGNGKTVLLAKNELPKNERSTPTLDKTSLETLTTQTTDTSATSRGTTFATINQTNSISTNTSDLDQENKNEERVNEIRWDIVFGITTGILTMIGLALAFLHCYNKSSFHASKVFPQHSTQGTEQRKPCLNEKPFSLTSADSGISPDTEGQLSAEATSSDANANGNNSQNPMEDQYLGPSPLPNVLSSGAENAKLEKIYVEPVSKALPSIFSPRPSPVTSPNKLPPLKEDLKIVEESEIAASLQATHVQPPTFGGAAPSASVFTISNLTTFKEQKPKRKRKSTRKSRGPRPKTAAVATRLQEASSPTAEAELHKMTSLTNEQLKQTNRTRVGKLRPLHTSESDTLAALQSPLTVEDHQEKVDQSKSSVNKTYGKVQSSPSKINFNEPPLFLSQLNRKTPSYRAHNDDNAGAFCPPCAPGHSQNQVLLPASQQLAGYENTDFSRRSTIVIAENRSLPAHSIEEAFESRNPRAFTIHRRQRLSPILQNRINRNPENSNT